RRPTAPGGLGRGRRPFRRPTRLRRRPPDRQDGVSRAPRSPRRAAAPARRRKHPRRPGGPPADTRRTARLPRPPNALRTAMKETPQLDETIATISIEDRLAIDELDSPYNLPL